MALRHYFGSLVVVSILAFIGNFPWYLVISIAILMASWSIASAIHDGNEILESIDDGIRKITEAIKDK